MLSLKLKQAGDTIVEVLIATAILGFVMGTAYSLTNKSLQKNQAAQERVEALKYVEGQLERLKYEARNNSDFSSTYRKANTVYFCFQQTSTVQTAVGGSAACTAGPGNRYALRINYVDNTSFADPKRFGTFNVEATWGRIGGGSDQMVINYQT